MSFTQKEKHFNYKDFVSEWFLSPYFALFFVIIAMLLYFVICYACRAKFGVFDVEKVGATEFTTYLFYGVSLCVMLMLRKDYLHTPLQKTFYSLGFLWLSALLREMGVQHWLTRHDSTAIKIRFFTNPNNPLHEKIITIVILAIVASVVIFLLRNYIGKVLAGIRNFQPVDWTIATLFVFGAITQFADRFPGNYTKSAGERLSEPVLFFLKILEEGGESLLPMLFAIALLQFHVILSQKR